jgi:hypothetical protein
MVASRASCKRDQLAVPLKPCRSEVSEPMMRRACPQFARDAFKAATTFRDVGSDLSYGQRAKAIVALVAIGSSRRRGSLADRRPNIYFR